MTTSTTDIKQQEIKDWEWFMDAFDILDEYDDIFKTTDYNRQQYDNEKLQQIIDEYTEDYDFEMLTTNLNEEQMIHSIADDSSKEQPIEEKLSQKLSQLSTHVQDDLEQRASQKRSRSLLSISDELQHKKRRAWADFKRDEQDEFDDYFEQLDEIFYKKMTAHLEHHHISNFIMEDVRDLAIVQHKIATAQLHRELCQTYLKLGSGQWTTNENIASNVDRCVWPAIVQSAASVDVKNTKDKSLQQHMYEKGIHQQIEKLNEAIVCYKQEYDKKKKTSRTQITIDLEQEIEQFVQQFSIKPYETRYQFKMNLLQYEYDGELIMREFLQYNPTESQLQLIQQLCDSRHMVLKTKFEIIELQKRVLFNKPPKLLFGQALSLIQSPRTPSNPNISSIADIDNEEKQAATIMMDLMTEQIMELENRMQRYQNEFNENIGKISIRTQTNQDGLDSKAVDLFYQRLTMINDVLECKSQFRTHYFLQYHYEMLPDTATLHKIRFAPSMIMRTAMHLFSDEQLRLLNRGPSYVPVYQTCSAFQERFNNHFKVLQHDLSIFYAKLNINTAQFMFLNKQIKDLYMNTFSNFPIPSMIQQRALYEKHLIESIDEQLKKYDLILRRTADQRNVFYLCDRQEFVEQTKEFMKRTDYFECCHIIDENNLQATKNFLTQKVKSLNEQFEEIFEDKKKYKHILESISISMEKVELPYLYFLPDVSREHEEKLPLVPFIVSPRSANARLAHFLNRLLNPFIKTCTQATYLKNGTDFMTKLSQYIHHDTQEKVHFQSTTQFVTIKIRNYSTMAAHADMFTALQNFMRKNTVLPIVDNVPLTKIYHLVLLFLQSNLFYFDHKIYRVMNGAPASLPLSETLNQMYAYQWEQKILQQASIREEFYGRCGHEIFFTWNQSMDEFHCLKRFIDQGSINMDLDIQINTNARFLGVYLENRHGTLYTRVDHDTTHQLYTLPHVIDRPIQMHSHWLRSSLIRAVRYCTSVHDFTRERIYLELSCFSNGYSLRFVDERIQHFLRHFNASSLRTCSDQQIYDELRKRLMNFTKEQQRWFEAKHDAEKKNQRMYLSYFYEYGPKRKFEQDLTSLLTPYIEKSTSNKPAAAIHKPRIILHTKQSYSLNALLSKQKPCHSLLTTN